MIARCYIGAGQATCQRKRTFRHRKRTPQAPRTYLLYRQPVFTPIDRTAPYRPNIAVVLAAGRSERLREVTRGGSKALVRVGGIALVERAVRSLLAAGIDRVVLMTGYHAGPV